MATILLVNPNTSARSLAMMLDVARPLLPQGCLIKGIRAATGVEMIVDERGLAIAADEVVRLVLAEPSVFEAVVVAAFGDPGVATLRDKLAGPVVGIGEASLLEAAEGGRRFGIATTTPGLVEAIAAMVSRLSLTARCTGVRVPNADPLRLAADPSAQERALAEAAEDCVRLDRADVVVIGGGPLSATARLLRRRLAIEIIEPVPAAIRATLRRLAAHARA